MPDRSDCADAERLAGLAAFRDHMRRRHGVRPPRPVARALLEAAVARLKKPLAKILDIRA